MQKSFVELHGVLQVRKVADLRQNQFTGPRNERCHMIGVLALDNFIAVAIHDPSRHLDAAQLVIREVRFGVLHLVKLL